MYTIILIHISITKYIGTLKVDNTMHNIHTIHSIVEVQLFQI